MHAQFTRHHGEKGVVLLGAKVIGTDGTSEVPAAQLNTAKPLLIMLVQMWLRMLITIAVVHTGLTHCSLKRQKIFLH